VDIENVTPYPLRLAEIFKPKIWGGRNLETVLGKRLPESELVGESWEVSDRPGDVSLVTNGPCAGCDLHSVVEAWGTGLLGRAKTERGRFPLLYKFVDANHVLSVQVHPDDTLAAELNEPDVGKTEMWYIVDSRAGGTLVGGIKPDVTAETFRQAIEDTALEPMLVDVAVNAGDTLFVAPGTVHAIGEGIVLAEIQQNSDLTYRVYDWGRVGDDGKPRQLHIEKAIRAIAFGRTPPGLASPVEVPEDAARRYILAASDYFAAEKLEIDEVWSDETSDTDSFQIVSCLKGHGSLISGNSTESVLPGNTLVIPAATVSYRIEGCVELLRFWVPDIERHIVPMLLRAGHSESTVRQLSGIDIRRG